MDENIKQMTIFDLVPDNWFKDFESSSVWLACYRVIGVQTDELASLPKIIDLNDVRAIILHGTLPFYKSPQLIVDDYRNLKIDFNQSELKCETKLGTYLLFLLPFKVDGIDGDEVLSEYKVSIAASLFAALNGRNMVYEHVFDNIILLNGTVSIDSSPILNPQWHKKPDISDKNLDIISTASKYILKLSEPEKNRVELSLRWFWSAIYDDGTDAYLKYWIACETLGMPDTTDITALNKILERAYNMDYNQVVRDFKIGKLFGLRAKIVHEGKMIPIHGQLLKYLETLYVDILFYKLDIPNERRAEKILNSEDFDFEEYYPNLKDNK
jgi:hypothetical protein